MGSGRGGKPFGHPLDGFDVTWRRRLDVTTMNGSLQPAFQLVARRRG